MLVPNAASRQLVTKQMLTSLCTCSRHVCFVKLRGLGGMGGCYNVPVNLLTSCMLRELRGLGGGGCSRPCELAHVMYAS